jgi:protein-serine/threonine kinase
MTEHEHGLGISGLNRIRQQPPHIQTRPPSLEPSHRSGPPSGSASLTVSLPTSRAPSVSLGAASPTLNFSEDLHRFPSESLHSFSFAHQTEESIHSRQNALKRSVDFLRDRLGWGAAGAGITAAQARVNGDHEAQSMMELLARVNLIPQEPRSASGFPSGPLTGPARVDGENVFEKSFWQRSESPEPIQSSLAIALTPEIDTLEIDTQYPRRDSAIDYEGSPGHEDRPTAQGGQEPEVASRAVTAEGERVVLSPPSVGRSSLKRTLTDTSALMLQDKLIDALAEPFVAGEDLAASAPLPSLVQSTGSAFSKHGPGVHGPGVHGHTNRYTPAAQAIFSTEAQPPWTIRAANDLACLVFGVTKAEVNKLGILEVVREERRGWLEEKLRSPGSDATLRSQSPSYIRIRRASPSPTSPPRMGNGVTAHLLSKPSSRQVADRRSKTDDGSGSNATKNTKESGSHHYYNKSRGVLLCGDVVPIQKRNGATGAASLWVKEKRGGLVWVLEEIKEDVAFIYLDQEGRVTRSTGDITAIWGEGRVTVGKDVGRLIPKLSRRHDMNGYGLDESGIAELVQFTARNVNSVNLPCSVENIPGECGIRVSSFPHIAGIVVLDAAALAITSSNSVFSAALFGQAKLDGMHITDLIPNFTRILRILTEQDHVKLVDGIVIPEHSFRRAGALLTSQDEKLDASFSFLRPNGLLAKHRDGSEIKVDVQMRVVKSETIVPEDVIEERSEEGSGSDVGAEALTEVVYALWITYSRHLHTTGPEGQPISPLLSRPSTPPHHPSPGQTINVVQPENMDSDESEAEERSMSLIAKELEEAASQPISNGAGKVKLEGESFAPVKVPPPEEKVELPKKKKAISDFVILEDMGQGAYGQVKLARHKKTSAKVVLKYVTKRRILVDTWTRDRRLGTVPLEIHVLDYLRRDGLKHPNILQMSDFFEDDINYYIEMVPHGLPGMDLFDYIELRVDMDEGECRSIFAQVADALHHLHTKALVVHRDIKDENVVLDGEGRIKLIDFGSAAYIKNGPFDVFVGTIGKNSPKNKNKNRWSC